MYATAKASAAKYISMQIVSKHKYNVFRVASAILPSYKYLDLTTETPINRCLFTNDCIDYTDY